MKLISCYIENFGAISKARFDFRGGITSFVNKNGAGKTTLAAFIKAMFYGLPAGRSNGKKFDARKRYYPFNGGKFGGSLTFEAGGEVYRIERTFGKAGASDDETAVYKGGKPTKELGFAVGESIFGLNESSFERTAYITAEEYEGGAGEDIINKLTGAVRADDCGLEEALKALDSHRKKLKAGRGSGGLIDVKKNERTRVRDEIENLKNTVRVLDGKYRERAELEARTEEMEKGFTSPTENKKGGQYAAVYALFALFTALFTAGAVTCAFILYLGAILAACGIAGLAFTFYLYRKKRAAPRDTGEISGVYGRLKDLRRSLGALDGEISAYEAETERLPALESALVRLDGEIDELTQKYETALLCGEFLQRAGGRIKERYSQPVTDRFLHYAEVIKPALGGKIVIGGDFTLRLEAGGMLTDERHMSAGQRCVCGLCMRLALIDCAFPKEKPFIILDDPFTALDGENMLGVRRALRALEKHMQIIYFTCHECREV